MQDFFRKPHEPPTTLNSLVERLSRKIAEGHEIVIVDDRYKLPGFHRWVIGAAGEQLNAIEVWLPENEHDQVYPTLGRIWKPIWGTGDCGRAAPVAPVSWSMIWTLGTAPLRVWNRRELILFLDATSLRGSATHGRVYQRAEVAVAATRKKYGGLCIACSIKLADGHSLEIASKWIPMKIFGPLAAMVGALYNDEDYDRDTGSILFSLAQRINEALASSSSTEQNDKKVAP